MKIKYFLFGLLFCLICLWLGSLIKCEILTNKHYDEFKYAYKQNSMLGEMEYFKVLDYETGGISNVYYVSKNKTAANILTFKYNFESESWEEILYKTIWSTTGSASEVIYPYWWHLIYGGF